MKIKMNKIWKLVVVALVFTTTAFGQQRGGPPQGGGSGGQQRSQQGPPEIPSDDEIEEMVENLASEILLSDEQESKVLELYKEHFETIEDKTKSGRPDRDEMETLKEDFEDAINAVLTKDQQELFTEYQKKNRKKRKSKNK